MQSRWFCRAFFLLVASIGVAGLLSGTACTRYGKPGPIPPTITPLSTIYVNPHSGNDTTGNGSQTKPYKSLTKAVEVLGAAKSFAASGVTIFLANGDYNVANGEKFPIVVPTAVTITGSGYGMGPSHGSFINGYGQDTAFEQLVHAPVRSAYTTLEAAATANVSLSDVYVGTSKLALPNSSAAYASFDVIGTLNASSSTLGTVVSKVRNANGVLVAGGSFTCSSCAIRGNDYAIGALSVTLAPTPPPSSPGPPSGTPTPSIVGPSITLSRSSGDSTIAGKIVDILTDGSVNVTVSGEAFEQGEYAFQDSLPQVVAVLTPGAVDFGGGFASSSGGNVFIGARVTEISITRRFTTVSALDDTWNPDQQGANRNGQYPKNKTFEPGATGANVTIAGIASGSTVTVGPALVPTPTPSASPSPSPSSSPT